MSCISIHFIHKYANSEQRAFYHTYMVYIGMPICSKILANNIHCRIHKLAFCVSFSFSRLNNRTDIVKRYPYTDAHSFYTFVQQRTSTASRSRTNTYLKWMFYSMAGYSKKCQRTKGDNKDIKCEHFPNRTFGTKLSFIEECVCAVRTHQLTQPLSVDVHFAFGQTHFATHFSLHFYFINYLMDVFFFFWLRPRYE